MSRTRLYNIWSNVIKRTESPEATGWEYYGGRGIKMCQDWRDSFEAFRDWATSNGYTDDLSIDRIDVDGNYEPNNCRWATQKEQMNNQRRHKV